MVKKIAKIVVIFSTWASTFICSILMKNIKMRYFRCIPQFTNFTKNAYRSESESNRTFPVRVRFGSTEFLKGRFGFGSVRVWGCEGWGWGREAIPVRNSGNWVETELQGIPGIPSDSGIPAIWRNSVSDE